MLIQSFKDEFGVRKNKNWDTPVLTGQILIKGEESELLEHGEHKSYRTGVGKLVYLSRWSRPDILNTVRELARYVSAPTKTHYKAMERCMEYCLATKNYGLELRPNVKWNGGKDLKFVIKGYADTSYAQHPESRKGASGNATTLNGAPVISKSITQTMVKLSVTEAELDSSMTEVQDMLFVMEIVESIGLQVEKLMELCTDNKGYLISQIIGQWEDGQDILQLNVHI